MTMKKIESATKTVSPADLKKALGIQTGVRAGLLTPPVGPKGCQGCGLSGAPGDVKEV
jgi:hypothetical protein